MNLSRLVAYNTLIQVFGKTVTVVFGITTTALLTNYLGPSGFGEYVFALSFVAIFSSVADWGTALIAVREAARQEKNENQIFGNVFILRLVLSLLATLISWLVIFLFPGVSSGGESLKRLVILASVLILFFSLKNSLGIIFQTKLKLDKVVFLDFVASVLTLCFSFFVVKFGGSLVFLIWAVIFANLIAVLVGFFLVFSLTGLKFSLSFPVLRSLWFEALPMGGVLILFSVYNRIDTLILQAIKGSTAVGVYGLAYRIYEVLVLGAFYLMNSLLPILAREKDKNKLCWVYQRVFDLLVLAGIFVILATFILAPLAIKLVAWNRFPEFFISISLLRILSLAVLASFLNHLTGYLLIVLGKQRRYFFISVAALIFNFSLNLFLIPSYSYYAAAWTTFLTETLVFGLTSFLIAKTLKFRPSFFSFPKTALDLLKTRQLF